MVLEGSNQQEQGRTVQSLAGTQLLIPRFAPPNEGETIAAFYAVSSEVIDIDDLYSLHMFSEVVVKPPDLEKT